MGRRRGIPAVALTRRALLGLLPLTAAACAPSLSGSPGAPMTTTTPSLSPGTQAAHSASEAARPFPAGLSGQGFFVDQHGSPVLLRGDSPWNLAIQLSPEAAARYLDEMAAADFNAAVVQAVCLPDGGGNAQGATFDGVTPFAHFDDWATGYQEEFWARVDAVFGNALDRGITVLFCPMFGESLDHLADQDTAHAQAFGQFLGRRYSAWPNLVWLLGGDWNTPWTGPENATVEALLAGIRESGDGHPATIELQPDTWSTSNGVVAHLVDVNWGYTYQASYRTLRAARASSPLPLVYGEGPYEGENNNGGPQTTDATLRRQVCWAYTSGVIGDVSGTRYWALRQAWEGSLDTTAMRQIRAIRNRVAAIRWWTLRPSTGLLTVGAGTDPPKGSQDGGGVDPLESDFATAAVDPEGHLALVYLPTQRTIGLDPSLLGADPVLTRIDPTSGEQSRLGWSTTVPGQGRNAAGDTDWLFLVTAD